MVRPRAPRDSRVGPEPWRGYGLLLLIGIVLTACSPSSAASPTSAAVRATESDDRITGETVVFAASSLTDAFTEIKAGFEQEHPDVRITFNFGASSQLRAQLEQGARADVFASADQAQMDAARQAGLLDGPDRVLARNRLTIVTPLANPKRISSLKDLGQEGTRLLTTQPSVPIGQYTLDLLDRASADPAYGVDFKERVLKNVVSREDNVRQLVGKIQLGEADAAIVYSSDVTPRVRDQVQQIAPPDTLNSLAIYPVAGTKGKNTAGGEAFVEYLLGPTAQEILASWGFIKARDEA